MFNASAIAAEIATATLEHDAIVAHYLTNGTKVMVIDARVAYGSLEIEVQERGHGTYCLPLAQHKTGPILAQCRRY